MGDGWSGRAGDDAETPPAQLMAFYMLNLLPYVTSLWEISPPGSNNTDGPSDAQNCLSAALIAGLATAALALDPTDSLHVKPVAIGECPVERARTVKGQ